MYDYVIVGAGSAGCVLAARLTEDPATRVLLLEAGPPDDAPEIRVPGAFFRLFRSPYDWDYSTEPQEHAAGRAVYWPRGRTLGGSSSTNAMVYVRGNRVDYDTWRDVYGCSGWGYAELLPYFIRAEDQERGASGFHGTGGPQRVEDPRHVHRLSGAFVAAAVAVGMPANDDFNGARQDGVGLHQLTGRGGRRWSTADGYLRPAMARGNLTVKTGTLVAKVLIEDGRAVGVRYRQDGQERQALAEGEVVLCAGAINTPQLLLLSGVGPGDHLRAHGVGVVADSPRVGVGLQDHPTLHLAWHTPTVRNVWEEALPDRLPGNQALWEREGCGPLATAGVEAGAFCRSRAGLPAPDLQLFCAAAPLVDEGLSMPDRRSVAIVAIGVEVRSRGRVWLRSADPAAKPAMDPAYLAHESDLDMLVAGVRQARQIAAAEPLASVIAGEDEPGDDVRGDEQVRAWIRRHVGTVYHPTSSCAMGAADSAVCDPELRVRGVDGLRVVDASVMPVIPRGNPNAPTIALAERAADVIRGRPALPPARLEEETTLIGRDTLP